jgi:hypothetical protein
MQQARLTGLQEAAQVRLSLEFWTTGTASSARSALPGPLRRMAKQRPDGREYS